MDKGQMQKDIVKISSILLRQKIHEGIRIRLEKHFPEQEVAKISSFI